MSLFGGWLALQRKRHLQNHLPICEHTTILFSSWQTFKSLLWNNTTEAALESHIQLIVWLQVVIYFWWRSTSEAAVAYRIQNSSRTDKLYSKEAALFPILTHNECARSHCSNFLLPSAIVLLRSLQSSRNGNSFRVWFVVSTDQHCYASLQLFGYY